MPKPNANFRRNSPNVIVWASNYYSRKRKVMRYDKNSIVFLHLVSASPIIFLIKGKLGLIRFKEITHFSCKV